MNKPQLPAIHVCIATGQNAANFIPLQQYGAVEVWILQTPSMKASADNLALALRQEGRTVRRKPLDDTDPATLTRSAEAIAEQLDGRHVVLHATGGTKPMVLALRDGLRLVEAGSGRLEILYADTPRQTIDWLGSDPRTEPMHDVLDLQKMLLVQGYRIEGDSRHRAAVKRASAPERARLTRFLGEGAGRHGNFFSPLAAMAHRAAADDAGTRDLQQQLQYPPGGPAAKLLREATTSGLLTWDGKVTLQFSAKEAASYFAGGWIEEYVLLKLSGLVRSERFASNLQVVSAAHGVPNELDAMVVHRNRTLVIECKSGRQDNATAALYKLAQLRDHLGGSVASALYVSAQRLAPEQMLRAREYRVSVLCGDDVASLPAWVRAWMAG